jgi:CRP-like cAMP-binding protein
VATMNEPRSMKVGDRPENLLLARMTDDERQRLSPELELVDLELREIVYDLNQVIDYVYFPVDCVISIIGIMADGTAVETATVGHEGFVGLPIFNGTDRTSSQAFCQIAGRAYRMRSEALRAEMREQGTLYRMMHLYSQALFTLIGQSSACNRVHLMTERCARWLLHCHDRVGAVTGTDSFALTHRFLSQMLGVRRASVTEALGALQRRGGIRYSMGLVTISDRAELERSSCECYAIIRREFDRLLGNQLPTPEPADPLTPLKTSYEGKSAAGDGTPRGPTEGVAVGVAEGGDGGDDGNDGRGDRSDGDGDGNTA